MSQPRLKENFMEITGTGYNNTAVIQTFASLMGISYERAHQLANMECQLTGLEYRSLKRCPASMIPTRTWYNARLRVMGALTKGLEKASPPAQLDISRGDNFNKVEIDKVLAKPHSGLKHYINIRPRRLLQSLRNERLLVDDVLEVARSVVFC